MKKNKIFLIAIFIIVLLILVVFLIINREEQTKINTSNQNIAGNDTFVANKKMEKIKSINTYQTMQNIINKFLNYIKENNINALKDVLIKENIELPQINFDFDYLVEGVSKYEPTIRQTIYLVEGKILNKNNYQSINYNFIIVNDEKNRTFKIAKQGEVFQNFIDYQNKKIDDKIEEEIKEINKNNYNNIDTVNGLGDKEIMTFYFQQYNLNILYNTENAFNMLDKEYSEKRFGTYENFVNYINDNKEKIEKSFIQKYKIEKFKNYKEFLCMDNFNNTYIFLEKEPLEYTVILDDYTVTDVINNKIYREKDRNGKAQINAEKFSHMLNVKDYDKAYAVLDNKFKEKYFPNLEDFKKYIIDIFYNSNKFEFIEISKEEGKYKIKTKIINNENEEESFIKRIKVELLENGEYTISFDI